MPTVLITGANRGIGLELAKSYTEKKYKVIAAVRDVSKMPEISGLIKVTYDAGSKTSALEAVKELQGKGIDSLDIVIANAAVNLKKEDLLELDSTVLEETLRVNVTGPLILFQATQPLLPKSTGKFIIISSGAGTINQVMKSGQGAYGVSKAGLNFLTRKLHFENPDYLIAAFDPGWVSTDMGRQGAVWTGLPNGEPPEDIKETVPGIIGLVEDGDKEKLGGWMTKLNGKRCEF